MDNLIIASVSVSTYHHMRFKSIFNPAMIMNLDSLIADDSERTFKVGGGSR